MLLLYLPVRWVGDFFCRDRKCPTTTMALDLLSSIRYLLKPEDISIDNFVFRLHYKMTVLVLLASSVVGVAKQYFGDPINCQVRKEEAFLLLPLRLPSWMAATQKADSFWHLPSPSRPTSTRPWAPSARPSPCPPSSSRRSCRN